MKKKLPVSCLDVSSYLIRSWESRLRQTCFPGATRRRVVVLDFGEPCAKDFWPIFCIVGLFVVDYYSDSVFFTGESSKSI